MENTVSVTFGKTCNASGYEVEISKRGADWIGVPAGISSGFVSLPPGCPCLPPDLHGQPDLR